MTRTGLAARSPSIAISAAYHLVDPSGAVLEDITGMISADKAGHVTRDPCAKLCGRAEFTVLGNLFWPTARIRITMRIRDTITGAIDEAAWGVYVPTTPDRTIGPRDADVFEVHGFDLIYFLDQPLERTWQVTDGADLHGAIDDLVTAAGVTLPVHLAPITGTIRGDRIFPMDEEVSYLDVINQLLRSAAWNDLYTLGDGTVTSEPWQPEAELAPVIHLDTTSPDTLMLESSRLRLDTFGVPNKWVVLDPSLAVDGAWPTEGAGIVTVVNQSDGPTSLDERGYTLRRRVEVEADSQAALAEIARRIAIEDRRPSGDMCLTTTPFLSLWQRSVVEVTDPQYGLDRNRFLIKKHRMPLQSGTKMQLHGMRI